MVKTAQKKPKSTLARNFINRRKEMGFTQESLAAASGVGLTTIKEIETDRSEGNPTTRKTLEATLKCLWEDLQQRPIETQWTSLTQKQMVDLIASLQTENDECRRQMKELQNDIKKLTRVIEGFRPTDLEPTLVGEDLKSQNETLKNQIKHLKSMVEMLEYDQTHKKLRTWDPNKIKAKIGSE